MVVVGVVSGCSRGCSWATWLVVVSGLGCSCRGVVGVVVVLVVAVL